MDTILNIIQTALPQLEREKLETVVDELVSNMGVEEPNDLQFIKEEDLKHLLTPIQCRKIIHYFRMDSNRVQSATSSPEPGTSTSMCPIQSMISCGNSSWLDRFEVPWNKMRTTLRRAIDACKRPEPEDRRHMVRVIVDSMREQSMNPTRKDCTAVAKYITQKYPNSFLDKTEEGDIIGCGYFSLLNQLKTRIEYANRGNTLSRLRKPKCSQTSDNQEPSASKCARIDSYGCINWQPQEYPEGETSVTLEEKRREMVDIYSREGLRAIERVRVQEPVKITYTKLREDINADPPPGIVDISQRWPFLLTWKFLLSHFTTLTGVDLHTRLNADLDKKGKRLLEYFRGQVTVTPADAAAQLSLPVTPRLIVLGDTVLSAKNWMLSIEGQVVIPHLSPMPDFITALAVLFASFYVFNIEYQVEAATTLEFVQRYFVRINPDSSKCTAKFKKSGKTGRTVKRKTSDMNPCVISFIRDFTEFDWKNN
ncbi:uncharacterized protein LOC143485891 [Brachyhypopomus gauderio]|uniref:uncharacterized protein LOC143485891 n=1 Tax=Brachyhypopomus gauderio TaxID=698409 RepID=UPI004042AD58